jgi:hypothetical protein
LESRQGVQQDDLASAQEVGRISQNICKVIPSFDFLMLSSDLRLLFLFGNFKIKRPGGKLFVLFYFKIT